MKVLLERGARGDDVSRAIHVWCGGSDDSARQDGPESFGAWVYTPDGRRVMANIRRAAEKAVCDGSAPVFCEAGLSDCARVYAPARADAQVKAVLRQAVCGWQAVEGTDDAGARLRRLRPDERGLVRGLYALVAPARQCMVRDTRAIWDALMERWQVSGLSVYVVERDGRAAGYMVLGAGGPAQYERGYATLYEYVALPDAGPGLCQALAASCSQGICAERGLVLGSALEREPSEAD